MTKRTAAGVRRAALLLPIILAFPAPGTGLHAQTGDSLGWKWSGKLTAVWAAGNSESSTFGLGSALRRVGTNTELKFDASGVRTESAIVTRRALGTAASFSVDETRERRKTAEAYTLRSRLDGRISDRFVAFTGVDWLRNTFAGIDSRLLLAVGAGNVWVARDDFRFKTDYGFTYTFQEDVVENPFTKSRFPGLRASWDIMRRITTTTVFESGLVTDFNIDNTDDIRADFTNALSVAINSRLSLKPGLQLLWRNDPALTEIELFSAQGTPTGVMVLVPLQKLDSFFTMALAVTL